MRAYDIAIVAAFVVLLCLLGATAFSGVCTVSAIARRAKTVSDDFVPMTRVVARMKETNIQYATGIRNYVAWRIERYVAAQRNAADRKRSKETADSFASLVARYEAFAAAHDSASGAALLRSAHTRVRSVGEAVIDAVERVALENGGHDRSNTVMAMLYSFENEAYALNDYIENTVEHDVNAALGKHMASIDAARDRARVQTAMFAGGASFIGAAIAVGVAVGFVAARKRSALLTEEMLLADERVRHDLSFQLHNQMGQDLSALKIFLGVLRTRHGSEEELVDSTAAVDRLVETMHATCDVLCPPGLEDLGLGATMKTLVAEYARMGFTVEANIADPCACSPEIALTVYRVAQEALTNAAKHASARHVEVALSRDGDRVCLSVKDDGNGFDTESAGRVREGYRKGGFGLASIHERLAIIGGSLRVTSRLGSGTALTAHVPAYIGGAR